MDVRLRRRLFDAFQPYFEGLLPEGRLDAPWRENSEFQSRSGSLLAACGGDCIGDVVVRNEDDQESFDTHRYDAVTQDDLVKMFLDRPSLAPEFGRSGARLT